LIIAPWWLSAWHSFIDAKYSTWSKKSDANPPEGDTKPPEGHNPLSLFIISSIQSAISLSGVTTGCLNAKPDVLNTY
jgi:hypothetical protein